MKLEELKNGKLLKQLVDEFDQDRTNDRMVKLFTILKDSTLWVPCNVEIGNNDPSKVSELLNDPDSLKDVMIASEDNVKITPATVGSGDHLYFPIFSTEEGLLQAGNGEYSTIPMHFYDVLYKAIENKGLKGIVLDPFSAGVVIPTDFYEPLMDLESEIEDQDYITPDLEALDQGNEAYELNTKEGYLKAKKAYEYAGTLYNAKANTQLGNIYLYGLGVEEDHELAIDYFEKAAKKQDVEAFMKLADFYYKGDIYSKDEHRAFSIYMQVLDYVESKHLVEYYGDIYYRVGRCFVSGAGIEKNLVKAYYYLTKSADYYKQSLEDHYYIKAKYEKTVELVKSCFKEMINDYNFKEFKDFRDLINQLIYVKYPMNNYEGFMGICYIDEIKGIVFNVLYACTLNEHAHDFSEIIEDTVIPYSKVKDCGYLNVSYRIDTSLVEEVDTRVNTILKEHQIKDPSLHTIRNASDLDMLRDENHPDVIQVYVGDKLVPFKCEGIANVDNQHRNIRGYLLSDPSKEVVVTLEREGNHTVAVVE